MGKKLHNKARKIGCYVALFHVILRDVEIPTSRKGVNFYTNLADNYSKVTFDQNFKEKQQ